MLPVSYLLFDLCSLSLAAYVVLFCCKNNLFEFYFLMHEDWCFCHTSLYHYCFPLCLVSSLVGVCVAGVEYQAYVMTTDLFHQMLCLNLTAAISWIFFEPHVKLSDVFIACGIPASVLTAVYSLLPHLTLVSLSNICLLQLWNQNPVLPWWGLIHLRGDRKVFSQKHYTPGVQGYPKGNQYDMVGM